VVEIDARSDRGFAGSDDDLFAEIVRLTEANRGGGDLETERRLLQLRDIAGSRLVAADQAHPRHVAPSEDALPEGPELPMFPAAELSPARLRSAILRDGCMLVRGLVDRSLATDLALQIERAFAERARMHAAPSWDRRCYEKFRGVSAAHPIPRRWIEETGGLLVADSPRLAFELFELLESAGVPELIAAYLGEPIALSLDKTTFRKVEPSVRGAWHQDGSFMGAVRSVNLWLSLSHCGDDAPGLDIVPRRQSDLVVSGAAGTYVATEVSQATAEAAAGDLGIVRPILEPGDAVLFDELCLHKTGSDPSMTKPRYAVETWFFGRSAFPDDYSPLAVLGGHRVA
jgi:hypothetical protein